MEEDKMKRVEIGIVITVIVAFLIEFSYIGYILRGETAYGLNHVNIGILVGVNASMIIMALGYLWKGMLGNMNRVEFGVVIGAIVSVFVIELGYLWGGATDYALQIAYYHYGGSWFPVPYGVLWTWLNPLWWTDVSYKVYLTGFIAGIGMLEGWLVKKKKFPLSVMLANQCQNIVWFLVNGYQHITTTAFQALSFWNPLFMFGWVFQEFPIGNPAGWSCDFGTPTLFYTLDNAQWQLCGPGDLVLGRLLWHVMEMVWVVIPMAYWSVKAWRYLRARN